MVAVTNRETANPLNHGEIATINAFYDIPARDRPAARDTIFVSTHEPCPLCLGGLTWGGWDNVFYLFSYEDTMDAFAIPHDIHLNEGDLAGQGWRVRPQEPLLVRLAHPRAHRSTPPTPACTNGPTG